jgi:aspartyl-tRNA(Asn)/glutamyl-tRNA(Gln) amidotransferase subunit C
MIEKAKITGKDVEYVARLARLELSAEEKEKFTGQLAAILEYIDKLNELDTSGVAATSHALNIENAWREDVLVQCPEETRERLLNNAPEREDDFFKVKKVIE